MKSKSSSYLDLAHKVAAQFKQIPSVQAISLGGSQTISSRDLSSDIDLYVYAPEVIPLRTRQKIAAQLGTRKADLNLTFWDLGDEWFDLETGIEVDVIYWSPAWIEDQISRVLKEYQAGLGYSTCFWHTVRNSQNLFDRSEWFSHLQNECQKPYPEPLKRAIIAKNHPVLRNVIPSYFMQIKKALSRQDLISINHRLAAFFASFFDVLFALNECTHPGEKKILDALAKPDMLVPANLKSQVREILRVGSVGELSLLSKLEDLLNSLDELLSRQGIDPSLTILLDKESGRI